MANHFPQWDLSLRCGLEGCAATRTIILSNVQPYGLGEREARRIWEEMRETAAGRRDHLAVDGVTKREMDELKHRFTLTEYASRP